MRWRCVAALGLCLVLNTAGAGASSEIPRAVTLAGNEVEATKDLGARSLLVVSFHRVANGSAREWRRVLDDDPRVEGWSIYTVIVLEGAPGFVRRMVVRALRGDVPAARQDSFLVVEEGAQPWRDLAGSNGGEENQEEAVFVVRLEDGEICARYRGLVSGVALSELLSASCEG
ncbi:MAG: hypothetical protein OXI49_11220 [Acidobacteriota bacterium]|nr:hypothetical protein [Acidobacteriota bacterium]